MLSPLFAPPDGHCSGEVEQECHHLNLRWFACCDESADGNKTSSLGGQRHASARLQAETGNPVTGLCDISRADVRVNLCLAANSGMGCKMAAPLYKLEHVSSCQSPSTDTSARGKWRFHGSGTCHEHSSRQFANRASAMFIGQRVCRLLRHVSGGVGDHNLSLIHILQHDAVERHCEHVSSLTTRPDHSRAFLPTFR